MSAFIKAKDIQFIKTCDFCPEQYDAVDSDGHIRGYLRLRNGYFEIYCPDVTAEEAIYTVEVQGNGDFYNQSERKRYLRKARGIISAWWNKICPVGQK